MTLTELLNSDMATIGRTLRGAFDWWVAELDNLVPAAVRRWNDAGVQTLHFDGAAGTITADDNEVSARSPVVALRPQDVLTRELATPPMSVAELARMLLLNGERYLPLPADTILLATATRGIVRDDGMMIADVAALPLIRARALAEALQMRQIVPRAVRIADGANRVDPRFDFLPALRSSGLVYGSPHHARNWWIVVGALAALSVAVAIWHDAAKVDRLQALVDTQRPAVGVAQRMTTQMRALDAVAQRSARRRGRSEPLALLELATTTVPDGAWVQRLTWNGATLRMTGYRSRDADVAAALRKMPGVATVKSTRSDTMTENAAGQPFDLIATMEVR